MTSADSTAAPSVPSSPSDRPGTAIRPSIATTLLLAAALGAGTLAGVAAVLVRQVLSASVLILVGCGLFLGQVLARVVKRTAMRQPTIAAVSALLASLVVVLIGHAWDYQQFRNVQAAVDPSARALVTRLSPDDPAQAEAAGVDLRAVKAMHVDTFTGYLDRAAREGVTVSALGRHPFNLGYAASYTYWLLEIAAVAALAARPCARAARRL